MKIVIDTNVLLSGVVFGGKPKELLLAMLNGCFKVYASEEIINEYRRIYANLKNKYKKDDSVYFDETLKAIHKCTTHSHIEVCRDPDDNKFIECAVDNKCIYIVSGDKDLLVLEKYEDVEILTVSQFLERYNG